MTEPAPIDVAEEVAEACSITPGATFVVAPDFETSIAYRGNHDGFELDRVCAHLHVQVYRTIRDDRHDFGDSG